MDQHTNLSDNAVIYTVYLNGEDDADKNSDILLEARRRYFVTHKKVKDKIFFTSGIDSVRCAYQIDVNKPMKWKKEVNNKLTEESQRQASGGYTVICNDLSGTLRKKLYFSNSNLWEKTEYYKNGFISATVSSVKSNDEITLAIQYSTQPPQILTAYKNVADSQNIITASAQTSEGEFFFALPVEDKVQKPENAEDEMIKRKGFFFDASLIYGDITTLDIRNNSNPTNSPKGEIKESNVKPAEDVKADVTVDEPIAESAPIEELTIGDAREEAANVVSENKIATAQKEIEISPKERYSYFGSLNKEGDRHGAGATLTKKGAVIYSGSYDKDKRSGFGAQFYKNGKLAYVGRWADDKKNGFGVAFLSDGSISTGNFENDKKKGISARFTADGNLTSVMSYQGDSSHGAAVTVDSNSGNLIVQKCDNGKMKNPVTVLNSQGGIIYNGEMTDGKYNGTGKLFDRNGNVKYSGEFKDNIQNGKGILYLDDNSTVSGEFSNGNIKGEAVHRAQDGTILYRGGFKNGEYHGKGTIYKSDGSYYSTSFENGKEKGAISVFTKDGELTYKGAIKNGEYNGNGALYQGGTKIYEGAFVNGKKSGLGRLFSDELCIYMGSFENDKRSGFGISYKNNSIVYSGFWDDDNYSGCGVLHNSGNELDYAGSFADNKMNGRVNVIKNGSLFKECIYENGNCTYMREYDADGAVLYEGSVVDGAREGMGCSYTKYGEKLFEGIFKYGEPYKPMRVIPKQLSELEYCDKLKDTPYINYKKPPVFVSEQFLGEGIYSGSLQNGKPYGNGTMLYTDHRYTGGFKNGKPCGEGVLYFGDGKEVSGEFAERSNDDTIAYEFSGAIYYLKGAGGEE